MRIPLQSPFFCVRSLPNADWLSIKAEKMEKKQKTPVIPEGNAMYIKAKKTQKCEHASVVAKCPICGNGGTFEPLQSEDLFIHDEGAAERYTVGHRMCPNRDCGAYLFFCKRKGPSEALFTFPSLRIDFKTENIPEKIRSCLEEASSPSCNPLGRAHLLGAGAGAAERLRSAV